MVNILSVEQYYGSTKRDDFENGIQEDFRKLHSCLVALRRRSGPIRCALSEDNDISVIQKAFAMMTGNLYCFATGLPDKKTTCAIPRAELVEAIQ